jgi:hypothetical protein
VTIFYVKHFHAKLNSGFMKKLFLISLIGLLLAACNQNDSGVFKYAEKGAMMADFDMQEASPAAPAIMDRKLIKTGNLSFETKDVFKTKTAIEEICKSENAYISDESQNNFEERLQYNQVIRVPAERFDDLIIQVEKIALRIENKSVNTQDVTEEFIDVEARLKTKRELEARYLELIKQAKAVADMVSIESQLANVRSEIESMQGRLQYLKNQVSLSTLHVTYYQPIGKDFGFFGKAARAMGHGWHNFMVFLVGVINVWPFLILAGITFFVVALWRKRTTKS